jgi:hypothetical protein
LLAANDALPVKRLRAFRVRGDGYFLPESRLGALRSYNFTHSIPRRAYILFVPLGKQGAPILILGKIANK